MERHFVVPTELQRGVPRDVRLTAAGRALYIAGVVLLVSALVVGVMLHATGVRDREDRRQLTESGVVTGAEIVRLWRASNEKKQPYVSYRFTAGERAYEGRAKVPLGKWRLLEAGGVFQIRYALEHPDLNVPADAEPRALPLWVPYLAATPIVLGGLICLYVIRCERGLLANGRPARAVVTKLRKHSSPHGGTHRSMKYEFRVLSGAAAAGKSDTSKKPPAVGSVICVVYDPERPKRNKPYPFQLVRASVE